MRDIALRWSTRADPLVPTAVFGRADAARALAKALLAMDPVRRGRLVGCAGPDLVVVLGDEATLPWAEGVTYLGRDPAAPRILLPTNRSPGVPADWLEQAILPSTAGTNGPWALCPRPSGLTLISLSAAGAISETRLRAWLTKAGADS